MFSSNVTQHSLIRVILAICIFMIFCQINRCQKDNKKDNIEPVEKYVLPYPVGESYSCTQSFSGSISHQGVFHYSVDFGMPKGTIITAARKGQIFYIQESFTDQDRGADRSNVVVIQHADDCFSRYAHISKNGAKVKLGEKVESGDTIALSGKTGARTYHLHFDVTKECSQTNCQTMAFQFKNCSPHHYPLQSGVMYKALEY